MSTDDADDYARARDWLKTLTGQVLRLRMDHRIWTEVQEVIKANPELHRPSEFYRWMRDMYVSGISMAIRRLTDDHTRSVSFFRFLKLVKGNPGLVSRRRYRKLFKDDDVFVEQLRELGLENDYPNDDYTRLVGGGKQPTPDQVQAELDEMRRLTEKIVALADTTVAHHDRERPAELPTFADVEVAIQLFERLLKRYRLLFDATSMSTDTTFQYDWKAIFRTPWIPRK
jgi:hypothetical protein